MYVKIKQAKEFDEHLPYVGCVGQVNYRYQEFAFLNLYVDGQLKYLRVPLKDIEEYSPYEQVAQDTNHYPKKHISKFIQNNPILNEVHGLLESQTKKGLEKYGNTVNPNEYSTVEWIEHAQQECIDKLVYLTILKHKIQEGIQ